MKVFISWSGERSHKVAELLSSWLKCVIQACKPWISSDMDRGIVWFNSINEALADTTTGIICITAENLNSPWILFESGSLSNGLSDKRVCTFLIDIKPSDLNPPLSQFNHTDASHVSMFSLVRTINDRLGEKKLELDTLTRVFETYYSQFEQQFNQIMNETKDVVSKQNQNVNVRTDKQVLEEVLLTVRNLNQRIQGIENESKIRSNLVYNTKDNKLLDEFLYGKPLTETLGSYVLANQRSSQIGDLILKLSQERKIPIMNATDIAIKYLESALIENNEIKKESIVNSST